MHSPLAGELLTRERILGWAGQFGAAVLVLAAWNRQLRGKVPNGVVLSTSWLLLSTGLAERVLWGVGRHGQGFGSTAGEDRCVSEQELPCSRKGQELVGMLTQAGQGIVSHVQPRNLRFPM